MKLTMLILIVSASVFAQKIPTDRTINEEGRRVYIANCIRCHNADPTKRGSIGPDLFTTPLEVFRTKVPKGSYPPKYIPKRKTKVMPRFPSLADKVDFIYQYIQTFKKK